ncbi:hypothetical protein L6452_43780 [Arctium lappa]|uniref:Uncharacterized protein n=1 Tax=Arctium lappa TaxID=4217 RepID=A0ACB8XDF9_ARCLA|nr:hypothetical protein L6452_43780 [Arctium lappa]
MGGGWRRSTSVRFASIHAAVRLMMLRLSHHFSCASNVATRFGQEKYQKQVGSTGFAHWMIVPVGTDMHFNLGMEGQDRPSRTMTPFDEYFFFTVMYLSSLKFLARDNGEHWRIKRRAGTV